GRGSIWDEAASDRGSARTTGNTEVENVPLTTLKPRNFLKVLYSKPRRGKLGIDINADRAIDIYTVPVDEFDRWRTRKEFTGSSFQRRKNLHVQYNFGPEFENDWYLVLENASDDPIDVVYDVFEG